MSELHLVWVNFGGLHRTLKLTGFEVFIIICLMAAAIHWLIKLNRKEAAEEALLRSKSTEKLVRNITSECLPRTQPAENIVETSRVEAKIKAKARRALQLEQEQSALIAYGEKYLNDTLPRKLPNAEKISVLSGMVFGSTRKQELSEHYRRITKLILKEAEPHVLDGPFSTAHGPKNLQKAMSASTNLRELCETPFAAYSQNSKITEEDLITVTRTLAANLQIIRMNGAVQPIPKMNQPLIYLDTPATRAAELALLRTSLEQWGPLAKQKIPVKFLNGSIWLQISTQKIGHIAYYDTLGEKLDMSLDEVINRSAGKKIRIEHLREWVAFVRAQATQPAPNQQHILPIPAAESTYSLQGFHPDVHANTS